MHGEGSLEGFSWLCSPEKAQPSDDPPAKQPPKTQTGPETPFPHLLSRCSRREQTPGEQTLPTCCYLSTGSYHARPRHFPSGNIWPAHDQKHILAVTNMLASSSLLSLVFSPLIHQLPHFLHPPQPSPMELYCQTDVSPDPQAPRHTARRKRKGSGRGVKEAAACNSLPGPEITPCISPSVPLFASQARVCSFLPRDPFLSPINTITAL